MSTVRVAVITKKYVGVGVIETELNSWSSSPYDDRSVSFMPSTSSWLVSDCICVSTWHV